MNETRHEPGFRREERTCGWRLSCPFLLTLAMGTLGATIPILGAEPPADATERGILVPPVMDPRVSQSPEKGAFTLDLSRLLVGEPDSGFPNWQERVMHEWMNRARVDPQADLAGCPAGNCAENTGGCYTPQNPMIWNGAAGRAARYHSAEMGRQSFFAHNSACTVVTNIGTLYPSSCDGSASCACVGGTSTCTSGCTTPSGRLSLFGSSYSGEIIAAGYSTVDSAFYAWLWEASSSTSCSFSSANGHRWLILKATSAIGTGYETVSGSPYGRYYTGDFGGTNSPIPKIPSGAHYPQQAASVDFWANWKDAAAPQAASVNVDGTCRTLTLQRGSATNGAWSVTGVTGLGTGCHRYYFTFRDSGGTEVTYPTTGSFGIGTTSCADWASSRPSACPPPAPTVSAVSPNSGSTAGGTSVTITGTSFVATPEVTFGGAAATAEVRVSSTTLTATVPAHAAGLANVVVTNPDAQSGTLANGYFYSAPPSASRYHAITPCRLFDTRNATGAAAAAPILGASETRTFDISGRCGVPDTALSLAVNVTVTGPGAAGELRIFPGNGISPYPPASAISYAAGKTRANNDVVRLSTDGTATLKVQNVSAGGVHLILDVSGYFLLAP